MWWVIAPTSNACMLTAHLCLLGYIKGEQASGRMQAKEGGGNHACLGGLLTDEMSVELTCGTRGVVAQQEEDY